MDKNYLDQLVEAMHKISDSLPQVRKEKKKRGKSKMMIAKNLDKKKKKRRKMAYKSRRINRLRV